MNYTKDDKKSERKATAQSYYVLTGSKLLGSV